MHLRPSQATEPGLENLDGLDRRFERPLPHLRLVPGRGVAVLLNANAKRVTKGVRRAFERVVPADDLFFSRSLAECDDFARTIIERRYSVVLAGGGDGTITAAINALLRAADRASSSIYRAALPDIGVLRLGTGNGLAGATGARRPLADVLRCLSGDIPRARPLQMIEEKSTHSVYPFLSLGYDAQLLNDYLAVCSNAKSRFTANLAKTLAGYFYALATRTIPSELRGSSKSHVRIQTLGRCSMLDPETDEEVPIQSGATLFEGVARGILMGTTPYYGFKMKVLPFADRRSDRFHLRVSTASIGTILANLGPIWKGTFRSPQFLDFLVESVRIESKSPLPYQTSGDAMGTRKELELSLSPRTFRVLDQLDSGR
jgi:diacylglycerol kinase family enzyme